MGVRVCVCVCVFIILHITAQPVCVCVCVCVVITFSRLGISRVANPARDQLNTENGILPVPVRSRELGSPLNLVHTYETQLSLPTFR